MKKILILLALTVWLIIICVFSLLAQTINVEVFFVLWLIGLLIIAELADTRYVRPRYMTTLMIITGVGTFIFGIIVLRKIWVIVSG